MDEVANRQRGCERESNHGSFALLYTPHTHAEALCFTYGEQCHEGWRLESKPHVVAALFVCISGEYNPNASPRKPALDSGNFDRVFRPQPDL